MTSIINASPSNGITQTADGSGVIKVQSNGVTTNALAWGSYIFVANGTVPTIRAAYNISSITRNSVGNYTFAFTNATTDANYTVVITSQLTNYTGGNVYAGIQATNSKTTSNFVALVGYVSNTTGSACTLFDSGLDFTIFGN